MKKFISLILSFAVGCAVYTPFTAVAEETDSFFDDFTGSRLDTDNWLIAEKNWGGTVNIDGEKVDYNGGVISDNVAVRDGNLILTGLGNLYEGELRGINRDGTRRSDGKRCGGAIATKEYYASGSYEIRAKIAPELGCCSAMWTFEYEEDYSGDNLKVTNHEIDIEFPGRDANDEPNLDYVLCTTWTGEGDDEHKTGSPYCGNQTDGAYHTYRFDWHTGDENEIPKVEYYFDDLLTYTSYEHIPPNAGRLWLGLWFPKYWAGTPDFNTAEFEIDYIKITPFYESGDKPQNESYPDSGWAEIKEPVMGDVNADGVFNVADVILFQKWLLAVPDTHLADWETADFCKDDRLNVFDFCLMKKALLSQEKTAVLTVTTNYGGYGVAGQDLGSGTFTETFAVRKGDTFYETMNGHWILNENTEYSTETPVLTVDEISDSEITFTSFLYGEQKKQTVRFGEELSEAVSSTFVIYDGINYSYVLTFSDKQL